MPLLLRDLRGGPDAPVLDAGESPQRAERPFHARLPRLDCERFGEALARAVSVGAKSFILPGAVGRPDVERFGAMLAVAEAEHDLPDNSLSIIAVADSAASILALPSLRPIPRLAGLACDPGRLASTLGCEIDAPAIVSARALTVLTASACSARAILFADTPSPDPCREAQREGFVAVLDVENHM